MAKIAVGDTVVIYGYNTIFGVHIIEYVTDSFVGDNKFTFDPDDLRKLSKDQGNYIPMSHNSSLEKTAIFAAQKSNSLWMLQLDIVKPQ